MSEHPFLLSSMFWHPVVGMLKFCTILITSAMSSASFNLCLMASIFFFQKKLWEIEYTAPSREWIFKFLGLFGRPTFLELSCDDSRLSRCHVMFTFNAKRPLIWSSEVTLKPDIIEILGENTSVINRFALLNYQSPADFKNNQSLILTLHQSASNRTMPQQKQMLFLYL